AYAWKPPPWEGSPLPAGGLRKTRPRVRDDCNAGRLAPNKDRGLGLLRPVVRTGCEIPAFHRRRAQPKVHRMCPLRGFRRPYRSTSRRDFAGPVPTPYSNTYAPFHCAWLHASAKVKARSRLAYDAGNTHRDHVSPPCADEA